MFSEYSEVRLKKDRADLGLPAGVEGIIVHVFTKPIEGYFIDFDPPYDEDFYIVGPEDIELVYAVSESEEDSNEPYPISQDDTAFKSKTTGIPGNTSDDRLRRKELNVSSMSPIPVALQPSQSNAHSTLTDSTSIVLPAAILEPKSAVMGFLSKYQRFSYTLLRLVFGFLFACHGAQKLFGVLGSNALPHNSLLFIAGIIEFGGGTMVFLGLFTRIAAFIASGEMAVAYFMIHAKLGFFPIVNRGELAVIYCFVGLIIAAKGAGQFSVDKSLSTSTL